MTDYSGQAAAAQAALEQAAEEYFGIKADPGDIEKLQTYLLKTYGALTSQNIKKVFSSGEAAGFLTVNETYFFREPVHFSFLRSFLPDFAQSGIRICCAAVATGCEAYSIAMLIEAYNKCAQSPVSYHIDAFDINPLVIETASLGIFSGRPLREDGSCFHYMADPYIKKLQNGYKTEYQVDVSLKKNINFFVHNLMNELPCKDYDFIFFRNAFIYFTQQNKERLFSNLSLALKNGGILIMGVCETAGASPSGLEHKNTGDVFYFQKPGNL